MINLKNKNFISMGDFSGDELLFLLEAVGGMRAKKKTGIKGELLLQNTNIILMYEWSSMLSRYGYEVACGDEGARITYEDFYHSSLGLYDTPELMATVLTHYFDAIVYRCHNHKNLEAFGKIARIPVINDCSDIEKPVDALAVMATAEQKCHTPVNELKLAFVGDGTSGLCTSLMLALSELGADFTICGPKELFPDRDILERCLDRAEKNGSELEVSSHLTALDGADVVIGDALFGDEEVIQYKAPLLEKYCITQKLLRETNQDVTWFCHDFPVFYSNNVDYVQNFQQNGLNIRGVDEDVLFGNQSAVFEQADNRLHSVKAVLCSLLGGSL